MGIWGICLEYHASKEDKINYYERDIVLKG